MESSGNEASVAWGPGTRTEDKPPGRREPPVHLHRCRDSVDNKGGPAGEAGKKTFSTKGDGLTEQTHGEKWK